MKTTKQHADYIRYWWGCPNFHLEEYIEQIMWESQHGTTQVVDVTIIEIDANDAAEEHALRNQD